MELHFRRILDQENVSQRLGRLPSAICRYLAEYSALGPRRVYTHNGSPFGSFRL